MLKHPEVSKLEWVRGKVDERGDDLFQQTLNNSSLQVYRGIRDGNGAVYELENQVVQDGDQIERLERDTYDYSQIFFIQQKRSWTNLDVTFQLFDTLMNTYKIFSDFWKCVLTFGRKFEENEFEFPGFAASYTPSSSPSDMLLVKSCEYAYMLRRVELHGRPTDEGQSPWSIRQTAVYHKYVFDQNCSDDCATESKSVFVLIAPSQNFERQLSGGLKLDVHQRHLVSPCKVQQLLVADSLKGWMDYMAWLEAKLKAQSDRVVFAKVGMKENNISSLADFNINFMDRQELKLLEDSVADLRIILPTLLNTVIQIRKQCQLGCSTYCVNTDHKWNCCWIVDQFDGYIRELEMHVERAHVLKDKIRSTATLLSDLLSYENAVALRNLTKETQNESKSMIELTERSTKDAAAVKALTVISLVYLPTTIVANFFSTQFVHTSDSGVMQVSTNAWLLAAIALPLTIVTVATWWLWVNGRGVASLKLPKKLKSEGFESKNLFKWILPCKKKTQDDMEAGIGVPQHYVYEEQDSPRTLTVATPTMQSAAEKYDY
ncbi:hypothetical protein K469DRAFT_707665 [Zopfia rhizophila CBS 207.26]|uniref:CorA-like transporter domain-containing protein n=1 Tax=Zopfia rhizophila CBS 207.26 TaxID=1314779 RepID=A0A6A6E5H1_9PEZI|nr:hypothetical protein K469DRAFT_707665 [Zopfia rhizophila CBS 207.26]